MSKQSDENNVITVLHVPMDDAWGKYYRQARVILLANDLPANEMRPIVRLLMAGDFRVGQPTVTSRPSCNSDAVSFPSIAFIRSKMVESEDNPSEANATSPDFAGPAPISCAYQS